MINARCAKKFCRDDISKIENYDNAIADTTQTWICHHRTEIWWNCTRKELIENECYYGRKALELIFLTREEHNRLHHTGKTISDEHRKTVSEAARRQFADPEQRKKHSEAMKAYWAKRKAAAEGGV